jgi:hypothetical protein
VLTPSKKFEPFIKINKQNAVNSKENRLFLIKKSIKNTFVEKIEIFIKNINEITIQSWIKNFFKGLLIINKSENIPSVNIKKEKKITS